MWPKIVNAVLEGNADAAAEAACESYQDQARELAAGFSGMNVHDIDLKYASARATMSKR